MHLIQTVSNQILTWTINRPERSNGLGFTIAQQLMTELVKLKEKFAHSTPQQYPFRALILTATLSGKNKDIWIAGGDLIELMQLKEGAEAKIYAETMTHVCNILESLPIPVIALVNGRAIGGGLELALAADFRIGTANTTFEFKQLKVGLATGYGSCARLIHMLGYSRTFKYLLNGKILAAQDALNLAMIDEYSETTDEAILVIDRLCNDILNTSPYAVAAQKKMLNNAKNIKLHDIQNYELEQFTALWRNPDHEAFLQNFASAKGKNE